MLKCACGEESCRNAIWLGGYNHDGNLTIWTRCRDGNDTLIYVDANGLVEFMKQLHNALLRMPLHGILEHE